MAEPFPPLSGAQVLDLLPQQEPFRFVDEILEVGDDHIVARYTFRPEADFYRGHFPGNPITPGVLLIEAMAQTGVVALGIYLVARERGVEEEHRPDGEEEPGAGVEEPEQPGAREPRDPGVVAHVVGEPGGGDGVAQRDARAVDIDLGVSVRTHAHLLEIGQHLGRDGKGYSRGMYGYDVFLNFHAGSSDVDVDALMCNNFQKSIGSPVFKDASLLLKLKGGAAGYGLWGDAPNEGKLAAGESVCLYQDSNGADSWDLTKAEIECRRQAMALMNFFRKPVQEYSLFHQMLLLICLSGKILPSGLLMSEHLRNLKAIACPVR